MDDGKVMEPRVTTISELWCVVGGFCRQVEKLTCDGEVGFSTGAAEQVQRGCTFNLRRHCYLYLQPFFLAKLPTTTSVSKNMQLWVTCN